MLAVLFICSVPTRFGIKLDWVKMYQCLHQMWSLSWLFKPFSHDSCETETKCFSLIYEILVLCVDFLKVPVYVYVSKTYNYTKILSGFTLSILMLLLKNKPHLKHTQKNIPLSNS